MKIQINSLALGALLLASCSSGNGDHKTNDSDSVKVPEISSGTVLPKPETKVLDNICLSAFEVKGPVCHIFSNDDFEKGMLTKFDKNGKLLYRFNSVRSYRVEVNDSAVILSDTPDGSISYVVKDGHLKSVSKAEANLYIQQQFTYKDNVLSQIVEKKEDDADGSSSSKSYVIKVLSVDSHGNWTSRMVGNKKQERKIDYYDDSQTISDLPFKFAQYEFSGTIGGDNNASMTLGPNDKYCFVNKGKRVLAVKEFNSGQLVLTASLNGKIIGLYDGHLFTNRTPFRYEGTFKNVNGGTVDFKLSLQGPLNDIYDSGN